ncbi:WD_REPEATS_REGION domain-containing protein, partial [Mortierella sp. 14UC]
MNNNPPKRPISDPGHVDYPNTTQPAKKRDRTEGQTNCLMEDNQYMLLKPPSEAPMLMSPSEAECATNMVSQGYPGFDSSTELTLPQNASRYLEQDLLAFKVQRLKGYRQPVFIPPMAKASLQTRDEDLFSLMNKVQEFLASDQQVMLILGDSGAGKSTFNRHLEHQLWTNYNKCGPIPLLINLPDIVQPEQDMVEKQLKENNFSEDQCRDLKLSRQFILICDGYDESQLTINLHKTNKLNQQGGWNSKMIITCRTQFLGPVYRNRFEPQPLDHYYPVQLNLFQEAVIAPFSKEQVKNYVARYVPLEPRPWVAEEYMRMLMTIPNLMNMVRNPFLLTLTLEALPGVTQGQQELSSIKITRVQLYDHFVDQWLGINMRRLQNCTLSDAEKDMLMHMNEKGFVALGIDFSKKLALAIFDKHGGIPVVQYIHLDHMNSWRAEFFGPQPKARLLCASSPLNRTGNLYQFLHRSMLEYFLSRAVFDPNTSTDVDEFAPQAEYGSSVTRLLDTNGPLFTRNLLEEPSVLQFLYERVPTSSAFKEQLLAVVE